MPVKKKKKKKRKKKKICDDRRPVGHDEDHGRVPSHLGDIKYKHTEQAPSPAQSNSQVGTVRTMATNPNAGSETITYDETPNLSDQINFETDVDELMKVIQRKPLHPPPMMLGKGTCLVSIELCIRTLCHGKYTATCEQ
ncbi:hypothetical protein FOXYSP1_19318 [Fusarium oxysporum f. sp. phaseoli]